MLIGRMAVVAGVLLAASVAGATTKGETHHPDPGIVVSCEGSPERAAFHLPPLINGWAAIECTQFGHRIIRQLQWSWKSRLSEEGTVAIWSQLHQPKRSVKNRAYWREFTLDEVDGRWRAYIVSRFEKWQEITLGDPERITVNQLRSVNSRGQQQRTYFLQRMGDSRVFGYHCNRLCDEGLPFELSKEGPSLDAFIQQKTKRSAKKRQVEEQVSRTTTVVTTEDDSEESAVVTTEIVTEVITEE